VSNNSIAAADISALINGVHAALRGRSVEKAPPVEDPQMPAVPIKKSVTPDHIVCLEDGKKF